jgi:hypothetical protein
MNAAGAPARARRHQGHPFVRAWMASARCRGGAGFARGGATELKAR